MLVNKGRGVAQLGSALGSGPRGREFKSPLPDQLYKRYQGVMEGVEATDTVTDTVFELCDSINDCCFFAASFKS